eukprot:2013341-Amphidinium_carterae.1
MDMKFAVAEGFMQVLRCYLEKRLWAFSWHYHKERRAGAPAFDLHGGANILPNTTTISTIERATLGCSLQLPTVAVLEKQSKLGQHGGQ